MTTDQTILALLLAAVLALLLWGRWRYDVVAFGALLLGVVTGVVPVANAFEGFGHPAVAVVALVLVVSRGLSNAGVVELLARFLVDKARSLSAHIGLMAGVAAAVSAFMNNVGALALFLPVAVRAARECGPRCWPRVLRGRCGHLRATR